MVYPPGGSSDILARSIANGMSRSLGQSVLIDYKPGGGTTIGTGAIAKSPPDGYTIGLLLTAHAINATLVPNLPYDTLKDFTSITLAATLPLVVEVNQQTQIQTLQELIDAAKADRGKLIYASGGSGSTNHLAAELFKSRVGIDVVHVPYKGSAPTITALLGREVNFMFDSLASSLPQIQAGKFRALAISTAKRSNLLPAIPTIQEAGVAGFDVSIWFGVFTPVATPASIVQKLNAEIIRAMAEPQAKLVIETAGYQIIGSTPAQLDAHVRGEIARWAKVVKESGAKLD